jgi:hypothetical protein
MKSWVLTACIQISILELTCLRGKGGEGDAQLRLSMPEMQQEVYGHPQHERARCREGEMPKMWREKTGATHHRVPGKNFQKELEF